MLWRVEIRSRKVTADMMIAATELAAGRTLGEESGPKARGEPVERTVIYAPA